MKKAAAKGRKRGAGKKTAAVGLSPAAVVDAFDLLVDMMDSRAIEAPHASDMAIWVDNHGTVENQLELLLAVAPIVRRIYEATG